METSLRTGFAQIFSRCPKNLSCPKFGGAAAPLAPPARTPMVGASFTSVKPNIKPIAVPVVVKWNGIHNSKCFIDVWDVVC